MSNSNQNTNLPEHFKKYFWDCDFESISIKNNMKFIAERILNYGDEKSIKWLLSKVNRQKLKSIVKTSRNLNKKTKNFWDNIIYE